MEDGSVTADKLDMALQGVRTLAEEAHLHNRPATLSVLSDCERALNRLAKRAAIPADLEEVVITQNRGPTVRFIGRLLAETQFETRGGALLEISLEIYETHGGALIGVSASTLPGGMGREDCRVTIAEPSEDLQAMRAKILHGFEWHDRARSMVRKLGWNLTVEVE